jgi:hypothetical protein
MARSDLLRDNVGLNFLLIMVNNALLDVLGGDPSDRRADSLELAATLLRSKRSSNSNTHSNDSSRDTHSRPISRRELALIGPDLVAFGNSIDDLRTRGRNHVSELVSQTRERTPESRGRQLVKMDRDDAPSTLDKELDEEAGGREAALALGEDPGGDHAGGEESSENYGTATADELREIADDGATNTGAGLHEDGGASCGSVGEVFLREHEGCIAVLAGVGVEIELQ